MTWVEFHDLFMGKYFPDTARHVKAQEFLELRQGTMTVMEYVARFTELAHFSDDYVATDVAKVKRFENGLKLPIRGRIIGLRLQDMDSMVGTALTIEKEIEDARGIRVADAGEKREDQPSSSSGKRQKTYASHEFQDQGRGWGIYSGKADDMLFLPTSWACETRLPPRTGIPGFWDNTVPVRCRTGEYTVHSSTP